MNDIKYYESDDDQLDEDLIESLVTLSIGTNPRSIKRLINSLSLIKILNDTKNESDSGSSGSAINNKDVAAYETNDFWRCVDSKRDLDFVRSLWDEGNASWIA